MGDVHASFPFANVSRCSFISFQYLCHKGRSHCAAKTERLCACTCEKAGVCACVCCVASGCSLRVPALLRPVQTELQPKAPPRLHRTGSGLFCFTERASEASVLPSPTCLALNPSSSSCCLRSIWQSVESERCCAASVGSKTQAEASTV